MSAPLAPRPTDRTITPIIRVSASSLSSEQFLQRFVATNQPVIVEGALEEWTGLLRAQKQSEAKGKDAPPVEWSISELSRLLGDTPVSNVFVASPEHKRRFKYFKQRGASGGGGGGDRASAQDASAAAAPSAATAAATPDTGLQRRGMPFSEFVQLSESSVQKDSKEASSYYVS